MKIVCDACQAKYSISDDKVQGKVFKIRCKKCSNIIVVRGGAGAAEPAPAPQQEKDTRVYDYGYEGGDHAPAGDDSVWHVVINQDQVGPMTAVEVQQRFAGGELDSETYIWREGFSDWLPLSQVDTFAALLAAGTPPAATPRSSGGGAEAVASMFGGGDETGSAGRSDPGDLFAAASASPARQDDDGGDLFGNKPTTASHAQQGGAKLRGERNENSVLFSLNNLAQLASDKPAPAAAHAATSPSALGAATGTSGGEGSGLIDIRSMASAYLGGPGGSSAKPATAGIGSIDDLPVFGGGGFSEPAVIVPIAARSNPNKLMYALIGSVGLLVVAAVIVVVVLLKGNDTRPPQVAAAVVPDKVEPAAPEKAADPAAGSAATGAPPIARAGDPAAGSAAGSSQAAVKAPDPKTPDAGDARGTHVAASDPEPKHPAATVHKPPAPSNPQPTQAKPPKPPAEKPAAVVAKPDPQPKGDSGSCDEVSCVLNNYEGACCAKFKKGGGKAPSGASGSTGGAKSDLPESLDRAMISDGVGKVKARVMSCGDKSPAKGQVKVSVKVSPDGHVTGVTVKNTPDPGLGNCVAGMMQKATFAKTQTGGSFAYPYTF
jgi:predicted Zn finger-like uncharacterized protein